MASVTVLIFTVWGPTITVPSDSGGLLAWIRPSSLAESFHQKSGHMGWLHFLQGSGNWFWQSPCSVFQTDIMACIPRKMNGCRVEQSSSVRRHLTGRKSLHYMCPAAIQDHISNNNKGLESSGIVWMIWPSVFTKACFHIPLQTSKVYVPLPVSWWRPKCPHW